MKLKRNMTIYIDAIDIAEIVAKESPEKIAKVFNEIAEKLHDQSTADFRLGLIAKCLNPYSKNLFESILLKKEKKRWIKWKLY